ncbi:MAG: prepilin-type N-terminal cleavage/methylation domain-containing protein [Phycisphaerales bacterium]|nr:prepilin-type N-terminal cleavage/methylation domain-containing protein [Phycisphaerales bacterium]
MIERVSRSGFTLLELCIALLIIALVVGGVLVGRDVLAVANVRATIGQVEHIKTAVHTFRGKYGAIPGDLSREDAASLGFFTLADGLGVANGNGALDALEPHPTPRAFTGEVPVFWRHLSEAGFIEGSLGRSGNSEVIASTGNTAGMVTQVDQSLPSAKIGRQNHVAVYSESGVTFLEINAVSRITAAGAYVVARPSLYPSEGHLVDQKMDDGVATTGNVVARGRVGLLGALNQEPDIATAPATNGCLSTAAPVVGYTPSDATGLCALRFLLGQP